MVDVASFIPDFLPFGREDTPAVAENLPTYRQQLANQLRDAELNRILNRYPDSITDAYRALQSQRVNVKGTAPYTKPEIGRGIIAAGEGRAVTPEPEGNIIQNFTGDVGALTSILNPLNLAKGIATEIADLPNFGTKLAEGLSKAQTPLETLGAIAKAPGIRFIPGSYIAGTLAPGGPGLAEGLYQHPLFSALDVLPYASKAARATPIVQAAEEARAAAVKSALSIPEAGIVAPTTRIAPIRTLVENYRPGAPGGFIKETVPLSEMQNLTQEVLVPNKIGQFTQGIGDYLRKAPLIQNVFDSSLPTRTLARILNIGDAQTRQFSSKIARTLSEETGFTIRKWMDDNPEILTLTPADRQAIYHHLQRPDQAPISDALRPFADDLTQRFNQLGAAHVAEGTLGEVNMLRGSELFPAEIAKRLNAAQATVRANADLLDSVYQEYDSPPPDTLMEPHPGAWDAAAPHLESFRANIDRADWRAALADLQALEATNKLPTVDYAAIRKSIGGDGGVLDLERANIPARWQPLIEETFKDLVTRGIETGKVGGRAGAVGKVLLPDGIPAAQALDWTRSGIYSWMDPAQRDAFLWDARATLHDTMANADALPVYVPHATMDQAVKAITAPSVFDHAPSIAALKERMLGRGPAVVEDPYLLLGHAAQQAINHGVQQRVGQYIVNNFGRRLADVRNEYLTTSGRLFEDASGLTSPRANLEKAIAEDYAAFNPNTWMDPRVETAGINALPDDTVLIPKQIHQALQDFSQPRRTQAGKVLDPVMKTFRHSVLTLSPRFYINNVFGGAILTALNARNPLTIAQHFKDAWNLVRNPEALTQLSDGTLLRRTDIMHMPPNESALQGLTEYALNLKSKPAILEAAYGFEGGKAMSKLWQKVENGAVKFNTINDQFFQTINFLEGRSNALNKGLSEAEAIQAGVESGRRFFETWDTLTPTERTIIKSIFPFYGFTRNLLKFTLQYPTTHPTRLAILSSIAKAEEEDFGSGLPQRFRQAFWLGSPDDKGRVTTLNIGGANPFQDVASYASLLGFITGAGGDFSAITRNVNPLISATLKQMGIDTFAGGSDLYPDMELNPVTGEPTAVPSGNALVNYATSIVPQASILTNLAGLNADFRAMLKSNPDAAGRTLLAAAGIPGYVRSVDVPTERMKAEVSRFTAARAARTEALKSGNWSAAEAWPTLRPFFEALAAQPRDALAPYALTDESSVPRALVAGVTGRR